MPLPWMKKSNKINRVSRFVNEIRASKRGESLVLQPGFPTSLIDLIVKNRNRLNNNSSSTTTSKKKKKNRSLCSSFEEIESTPRTPLAPLILNSISTLLAASESESDWSDSGKEICVLKCEEEELKCIQAPVTNRIFIICIQLFVILVLALGTKKLAIGITLSTFILMFLEILLKRLKVSIDLVKGKSLTGAEESNNFVEECNSLIEEKRDNDIDLDSGKNDCDQKTAVLKDCEETNECAELGNPRRTNSAKLRAKQFKKFVAKKFGGDPKNRRSNKEGMLNPSNVEERVEEEKEVDEEEQEVDEADGCESTRDSDASFQENLGRKTNWSWRTFIPIGIILSGLVGGRIIAMVLSILGLVLINLHKVLRAPRDKYTFDESCSKKCSSL